MHIVGGHEAPARYIKLTEAGHLIHPLQALAMAAPEPLLTINVSAYPFDKFLLASAEISSAPYVVSGDKADVLALNGHPQIESAVCAALRTRLGCAEALV